MLWMGVKRPLCPFCDSSMPMRKMMVSSEIGKSSMVIAKEYWVCKKCHRKFPTREQ